MTSTKQGVMSLTIRDKATLHACYMPFLKNGGLFIPTDQVFELGDEVFLLLNLMDEAQRYSVTGKVVWINPKATSGQRPAGVGIQFKGIEGEKLQAKIEVYLQDFANPDAPVHTM